MPEKVNSGAVPEDRKLGEEWEDWDGGEERSGEASQDLFVRLAGALAAGLAALGGLVSWLVYPRLAGLGLDWLAWLPGAGAAAYFGVWWLSLRLASWGKTGFGRMVKKLGGIHWAIAPCVRLARTLGISRDRVGSAFVKLHNRLLVLPPLLQEAGHLLLIVPRCLGRESLQALRTLQTRYGFVCITAVGGSEARQAIRKHRPEGLIAVACERDLLAGIRDVRGRIPLLAFSNLRPEGPCKNTTVDIAAVEKAVTLFLGKFQGDSVP